LEITKREVRPEDIEGIVLRPADVAECERGGMTPEQALHLSVDNAMACWAIEVEGELAAIWGFSVRTFMDNSKCYAWMLTTPVCDKHKALFVRVSQAMIAELNEQFASIEVWVDDRHVAALSWLRWLKFEFVKFAPLEGFLIMRRSR
jgi:hypothetical protein